MPVALDVFSVLACFAAILACHPLFLVFIALLRQAALRLVEGLVRGHFFNGVGQPNLREL